MQTKNSEAAPAFALAGPVSRILAAFRTAIGSVERTKMGVLCRTPIMVQLCWVAS